MCAESWQHSEFRNKPLQPPFLCDFFIFLFNYRPQADPSTLIRLCSMLRSYFMIPAGCIPVIFTQPSITLAFKKQTSIDLLTHSVVSYDAQILPLCLHLQARRELISSPSLCKRFLFTRPPAHPPALHSRSPPHPQYRNRTTAENNRTPRYICKDPEIKSFTSKLYRLLPPFYQGSPIFAFKVQIAQNMVLFCRL